MTPAVTRRAAALATGAVLVACVTASAQSNAASAGPWRAWRPALMVGGGWLGPDALGRVSADTRAATPGTATPAAATLFRTTSTLGGAPRLEAGVAVPITSRLLVELGATVARPTLTTRLDGDVEGAPSVAATEQVDEYTVGGRAIVEMTRWAWRRRVRPFLAAGGAYLRQLHEDNVLVDTGQVWSVGGGVRWWARRSQGRPLGVSLESGWSWRSGGIVFTDGTRSMPWVGLRAFAGF